MLWQSSSSACYFREMQAGRVGSGACIGLTGTMRRDGISNVHSMLFRALGALFGRVRRTLASRPGVVALVMLFGDLYLSGGGPL